MRLESLAIRHRQTHGLASPWRDAWRIPMETTEQAVPGPDFSPLVAYLLESSADDGGCQLSCHLGSRL